MNFLKLKFLYFAISLTVISIGLYSLANRSLKVAVDFSGGSKIVMTSPDPQKLEELVNQNFDNPKIQKINNNLEITTSPMDRSKLDEFVGKLKDQKLDHTVESFTAIGPSAGKRLIEQTTTALILAVLFITFYISRAFKSLSYGLAAITATLHDTLVIIGTYAFLARFLNLSLDLLFVTALLTSLSFSVHDTIVVFDRIRELKKTKHQSSFDHLANIAITQTLTRSLNNSLTIIFMLSSLFLFTSDSLKSFVLTLLIGAITGTYSSTFTAIPLLSVMEKIRLNRRNS